MIITSGHEVVGEEILMYKGMVFGEVITGANFMKDFGAGIRNVFGGRARGYEKELVKAREEAIAEMEERAEALGATAIIGFSCDYQVLGTENDMLMVSCSGTAVLSREA